LPPAVEPGSCLACSGRWPRADHRIADLGVSVAYLHADQFFPGWTVLVLKRHATELYELSREERAGLMEEVSEVARVLATTFHAIKVNYELLGNQIPHIHWHIVPRLARAIIAMARMLVDKHGGQVPADRERLTALPGVGLKTANVVLGNAFGQAAIAVDTHVLRVCLRLGLARS
jgi:diadenosine tetraphosphate (Ap4A) HIT family hydrolase